MRKPGLLSLSLLWFFVFSAGCGSPSRDSTGAPSGESQAARHKTVVVFGAASTTNALGELCEAFHKENDTEVLSNFASSSVLAQQIINGAGADVFLSANVKWADAVAREDLIARRVNLLGNRLVVIVPADSRLSLRTIEDLKTAPTERLALADPSSAPAGIYAKQALETLGLWSALERKVVAGADVRQALAYVEQGAAEAGIVYATDAAISDRVKVLSDIPLDADPPIIYPLILLKPAEGNAAAESLYSYLQSDEAIAIFEKHGFVPGTKPVEAAP